MGKREEETHTAIYLHRQADGDIHPTQVSGPKLFLPIRSGGNTVAFGNTNNHLSIGGSISVL